VLVMSCPTAEAESDAPYYLGICPAVIRLNAFGAGASGNLPLAYYKTGATPPLCSADSWHLYNGVSFESAGWIQVRLVKAE
jgi:hypothetical protein